MWAIQLLFRMLLMGSSSKWQLARLDSIGSTLSYFVGMRTENCATGSVYDCSCHVAGYWGALQLLAQHPHLPAFKGMQGMLPALAEHGQLLALASVMSQVCLLCQSLSGLHVPYSASGV